MRLAVIGTFHLRHENSFALMHRLFVDSTKKPDEAWLMCEDYSDRVAIQMALHELYEMDLIGPMIPGLKVLAHPTPRNDNGGYQMIPYSRKINWALDRTQADAVVYLDNASMPSSYKYEKMLSALEANPDWGAVYCGQQRLGMTEMFSPADAVVGDAYCNLNYTQVMHRKTADRWPTDMQFANPDLADATFWRMLHVSLGDFYPVEGLDDWHRIDGPAAQGVV